MLFNSNLFNLFPFIIIDSNQLTIKKISTSLKNNNFKIGNNFFYYTNNEVFKESLLNKEKELPIMEIIDNNEKKSYKVNVEYKKNEFILLLSDVTNIINKTKNLNEKIKNLILDNKKVKKRINKYYELYNEINFIFCIFDHNKIIYKNNFFDYLFQNKEIKEIFKEEYNEIIYKLEIKQQIQNKILYWKNNYYEIFLSKHDNEYYLIGHNVNKHFQNEKELMYNYQAIINIIGYAVHKKSKFTNKHINNVKILTKKIALFYQKEYGLLLKEDIELLSFASALHDIGKLKISSSILEKKGRLTKIERIEMNKHPTYGKELIDLYCDNGTNQSKLMKICSLVAYEHHEKWNGKGYPLEKKEEEIHLYSRIVALADVLEALMVKRPYKEAWLKEDIIIFLKKEKGESFDPLITQIVLDNYDDLDNFIKK